MSPSTVETSESLHERLARVAESCRHMPESEILPRVGSALAASGLAITATNQELVHQDHRSTTVRVASTVQAPDGATATFAGLGKSEGPQALGGAILVALHAQWVGALLIDLGGQEPDYARDAAAWEAHLRNCRHGAHLRNAWRKHREAFEFAGVLRARRGAALDALANFKGARGERYTEAQLHSYLDAEPEPKDLTAERGGRAR